MFQFLKQLKNIDYYPSVILDIGAYHGNWTKKMLSIYPNSIYYLFEGIDYEELNIFENIHNIHLYKNILLNDKIEVIDWYQEKNSGDSFYKELSKFFKNTIPIKKKTIDLNTIIKNNNILNNNNKNIFINIDCQGSEISILKGATQILNNTDFIILKIPLFGIYNNNTPNFLEHIKFMENIGFVIYDIIDKDYYKNFNIHVNVLFININSDYYIKFKNTPKIHSIMLSSFGREHVINYITEKKKKTKFKVIDIGGSADYTNWSYSIIDYIVDINKPLDNINDTHIKYFNLNINFESEWKILFDYVKKNGKFDFCICSHTIEDISLPQVFLNNIKYIANEGFIGVPSKYRELAKFDGPHMGWMHHRWIYSIKNNKLIGFPKLNFLDSQQNLINIGDVSNDILDLSFFWENDIPYSIINNDYIGPTKEAIISYYNELTFDDIDIYNKKNIYHIEHIKTIGQIQNNFILLIMLIDNLINDLIFMDNLGFIPFEIQDSSNNIGKKSIHILFINKNHEYNTIIKELFYK